MDWIKDPQAWIAFATLLSLEIVLGIDNVIFISILADKLPPEQRKKARTIGLSLAMIVRLGLLFSLSWMTRLTSPLFAVIGHEISGRDLILLLGGLFLIAKATHEIHEKLEGEEGPLETKVHATFASIIVQILLLDIVFSLDSVITAIGMTDRLSLMVAAVVISVIIILSLAGAIIRFVERRPTIKMLALSFLLLIGLVLVAEGWGQHVSKGYLYFAMGFSLFVEMLNIKIRDGRRKSRL